MNRGSFYSRLISMFLLAPACFAQNRALTLAYQLTHVDTGEPDPSPDGKKIVYESLVAGTYQIFTMNTDGTGQVQITNNKENHDNPIWSPDGKRIAFVSDKGAGAEVVAVINADGSGEEQITSDEIRAIHPKWAPDGESLIYCTDDDLKPPQKNPSDIYLVDLATKTSKMVISGGTNTYPSYSPDGKRIVFRRMLGEMNSEVFVADADGTNVRNLTNHPAFDGWPAWSPDGKRIAFSSNRRANYQIHVMNADGTNVRLVANTEGRATEPRWSIDGSKIYFSNCQKKDFGVDCQILVAELPN